MKYTEIIVETDEKHVGAITLNRPKHLNTFSSKMSGELSEALVALDADKTVRVILLKGAGKAFCAGIDVNELTFASSVPEMVALESEGWAAMYINDIKHLSPV